MRYKSHFKVTGEIYFRNMRKYLSFKRNKRMKKTQLINKKFVTCMITTNK